MKIQTYDGDVFIHKGSVARAGAVVALSVVAGLSQNKVVSVLAGAAALGLATLPMVYAQPGSTPGGSGTPPAVPA